MITAGFSSASAREATRRAARACTRSVSMKVLTWRDVPAPTKRTFTPARSTAPANSRSEMRQPKVSPAETISTSGEEAGAMSRQWVLDPRSGVPRSGGAVQLEEVGAEARRADELDGLQGRSPLDIEPGAIAFLDRGHGRCLAPPGQRPDDRESGRDRRDLRQDQAGCAGAQREQQQRPQAVEHRAGRVDLGQ